MELLVSLGCFKNKKFFLSDTSINIINPVFLITGRIIKSNFRKEAAPRGSEQQMKFFTSNPNPMTCIFNIVIIIIIIINNNAGPQVPDLPPIINQTPATR